jgi:hypothetical protein
LLVLGAAVILCVTIYWFIGLQFLSNVLGFVPIFRSFKALRSPKNSDDYTELTYWVSYGMFSLVESFVLSIEFLLSFLPFYYFAKMFLLVWLYAGGGALTLYNRVLDPLLTRYVLDADEEIEQHSENNDESKSS